MHSSATRTRMTPFSEGFNPNGEINMHRETSMARPGPSISEQSGRCLASDPKDRPARQPHCARPVCTSCTGTRLRKAEHQRNSGTRLALHRALSAMMNDGGALKDARAEQAGHKKGPPLGSAQALIGWRYRRGRKTASALRSSMDQNWTRRSGSEGS